MSSVSCVYDARGSRKYWLVEKAYRAPPRISTLGSAARRPRYSAPPLGDTLA